MDSRVNRTNCSTRLWLLSPIWAEPQHRYCSEGCRLDMAGPQRFSTLWSDRDSSGRLRARNREKSCRRRTNSANESANDSKKTLIEDGVQLGLKPGFTGKTH